MIKIYFNALLIFVLLFLFVVLFFALDLAKRNFVSAVNQPYVIINEICWMGSKVSHSDEWIELYNNSDTDINLDKWILKANDGSPEIKLSDFILAKGFYLLERTNDDSAAEASADIIYKGTLNNKGEILELFDNNENLIDKVDCPDGWFAGDNKTKQTMERPVDAKHQQVHWQTSQEQGGTPKTKNSGGYSNAESDGEVKPPQKPLSSDSGKAELHQGFKQVQMSENHSEVLGVNKFPTSLIALTIAFCSAIIVLILKKNLKNN